VTLTSPGYGKPLRQSTEQTGNQHRVDLQSGAGNPISQMATSWCDATQFQCGLRLRLKQDRLSRVKDSFEKPIRNIGNPGNLGLMTPVCVKTQDVI
jgi:hypothetical protein